MIRTFLEEFVFPLLIFLFVRSLLRGFLAKPKAGVARPSESPPPSAMELKQDPVCGTYVASNTSFTRAVRGQVLHFCSEECRDKYRA